MENIDKIANYIKADNDFFNNITQLLQKSGFKLKNKQKNKAIYYKTFRHDREYNIIITIENSTVIIDIKSPKGYSVRWLRVDKNLDDIKKLLNSLIEQLYLDNDN